MLRKIIASLLSLTVILSFTSCNASKKDVFTAPDGVEYIVARDNDGNIVINDNDKLQVYTLNENGKKQKTDSGDYITEFIDFNGQVVIDNVIETAELRFTLPKTFVADDNNPGYFYSEELNGEIFFTFYGDSIDMHIQGVEKNGENLLESYGSEAFSYEKYSVTISDNECTAYRFACTSSEYYNHAYYFFVPYDTGFYYINCFVSTENAKKVDFNKFAETIELK